MSAGFHDFKIIQKEGTPFKTILLDGQELQGVMRVEVEMEANSLTKVTLEIHTDKAEIDLKGEPMDIEEAEPEPSSPALYAWDEPVYIEKYEGKKD